MKIVVFEVEHHEAHAFKSLETKNEIVLVAEPLRAANASTFSNAEIISTFIYSEVGRRVLEDLPALKMIATRSTGFDHIDIAYCAERGITVCNVPTYGANTVAEHVFALLLSISHRMREAVDRARSGEFSPLGLQGFDLAGRTLGVVGTGSIGRHVIRIARGFEMVVVACDSKPDDALSRGSLVDVRALIEALRRGRVGAAGLDVLSDEPMIREEAELICSEFCSHRDLRELVADHLLLNMKNVVVTPHSAFNSREAVGRIADTSVENINAYIAGRPRNVVTGPRL